MGPLGGFTSAIPTLWCTLRGLGRDAQRAVIQNFNLAMLATTMTSYLAAGIVTPPMLPLMAVVALAVVFPALAGMKVYVGISPHSGRLLRSVVLESLRAVRQIRERVALQLTRDGRGAAAQRPGHGPGAEPLLLHAGHRHPVLG